MSEIRLRGDKLQWLQTEGEVVALDESSLSYLGVNESGTLLWQELATGTTKDRLVTTLVDRFGIDAAAATTDVDAFLSDLARHDLLAP